MKPTRQTWILELRREPDLPESEESVSMKMALKVLLRTYRFKCLRLLPEFPEPIDKGATLDAPEPKENP